MSFILVSVSMSPQPSLVRREAGLPLPNTSSCCTIVSKRRSERFDLGIHQILVSKLRRGALGVAFGLNCLQHRNSLQMTSDGTCAKQSRYQSELLLLLERS